MPVYRLVLEIADVKVHTDWSECPSTTLNNFERIKQTLEPTSFYFEEKENPQNPSSRSCTEDSFRQMAKRFT